MIFKLFLFAAMVVISSADRLSLPSNFTWPLNTKNKCFVARFKLNLNIDYKKNDGSAASAKIPLDGDTFESYSATCDAPNNVHQLTISLLNPFTAVIFKFVLNETNTTSLTNVYGYITIDDRQSFISDSDSAMGLTKFSSNQSLFVSDRSNSYRCNTKTEINQITTINGNLTIKSIDVENLRVQAFPDSTQEFIDYDAEVVCQADVDKNSNLIPIIVGACLAVLVVVVLVAYLIGRRRSRGGYQSV